METCGFSFLRTRVISLFFLKYVVVRFRSGGFVSFLGVWLLYRCLRCEKVFFWILELIFGFFFVGLVRFLYLSVFCFYCCFVDLVWLVWFWDVFLVLSIFSFLLVLVIEFSIFYIFGFFFEEVLVFRGNFFRKIWWLVKS